MVAGRERTPSRGICNCHQKSAKTLKATGLKISLRDYQSENWPYGKNSTLNATNIL